jgi:hypothetical protein
MKTKSNKTIKTAKVIRPTKIIATARPIPTLHMSIEEMIKLITEAIQFKYSGDKTAPGLTIARLKNGVMYVSIIRYSAPFGKDKQVEYKARNHDLIAALYDVACQITDQTMDTNPLDQLSRYLHVGASIRKLAT